MTCVVGIAGADGVLLAGDRIAVRVSAGEAYDIGSKVFTKGETVAFGSCGGIRESQIVQHHVADNGVGTWDELEWAVKVFIPAIRKQLDEHGSLAKDGEQEAYGGEFVLAVRGRLFQGFSDFSLIETDYCASGSGEAHARSILHDAKLAHDDGSKLTVKELLPIAKKAIGAAADLTAYVGMGTMHVSTKLWTDDERKWAQRVVA